MCLINEGCFHFRTIWHGSSFRCDSALGGTAGPRAAFPSSNQKRTLDATGKVLGDSKLQAEGKADKVKGKIENVVGGAKDAGRDAINK